MPEVILEDLACSQVSIFARKRSRVSSRRDAEMTTVVNHHGIRHGHMVNINRQIMLEGMRADFREIDALEPAPGRTRAAGRTRQLQDAERHRFSRPSFRRN